MNLTEKKCVPCEGGTKPLQNNKINEYLKILDPDWQVIDYKSIKRKFKFTDFNSSIQFVNKLAKVAEAEGHHPDITINYNKVIIELTTHSIGGLSENDFIMAAKIEQINKMC